MTIELIWVALGGLVIGSFLNVVIYRLPRKMSIISPRSHCPNCKVNISWRNNIPVLSYLLNRGVCSACSSKISFRYPLVELITAVLFLTVALRSGLTPVAIFKWMVFAAGCIAIVFIDIEHRIIPDKLSLGGMVYGVIVTLLLDSDFFYTGLMGGLFGFGFFYLTALLYQMISGRSGLGGGDIKLLGAFGVFLGPLGVFYIILVSSLVGSVWGLIVSRSSKDTRIGQVAIPYGPFLVIGALVYYHFGDFLWLQYTKPI